MGNNRYGLGPLVPLALALVLLVGCGRATGAADAKATATPGGAVATKGTATATPKPDKTPPATPTLTVEQVEGQQVAAAIGAGLTDFRATEQECKQAVALQQSEGCSAPADAMVVTRPEWEALFPKTTFYLVSFVSHSSSVTTDYNPYHVALAGWQDGRLYTLADADKLLSVNGIAITDKNRPLVARALALMTLKDYLREEIVFSDEGPIRESGTFSDEQFTYALRVWTKLRGVTLRYRYIFSDPTVVNIEGYVESLGTGDFLPDPVAELNPVVPSGIVVDQYYFPGR